jgi:hypothetical protein
MRRSLILGLCIVLCGAMVAQADYLASWTGADAPLVGSVSYSVTSIGSSIDAVKVYFSAPVTISGTADACQFMEGTWTANQGYWLGNTAENQASTLDGVSVSKSGTSYHMTISNAAGTGNSYMNFDTAINQSYWELDDNGNAGQMTYWAGGWVASYNGSYNPANGGWQEPDTRLSYNGGSLASTNGSGSLDRTMLATFYVTDGTTLKFAGTPGWGGWGFSNSVNLHGSVSVYAHVAPLPEPSMMVLAASGLIGLLCYAWRKRR